MDFSRIIQQDGYRRKDLSKENQKILRWLDFLLEDLEDIKDNLDEFDEDITDDSVIGKMKKEYALKVIDFIEMWMDATVDEIQVSLAESEENE